jgi:hypothetical protein
MPRSLLAEYEEWLQAPLPSRAPRPRSAPGRHPPAGRPRSRPARPRPVAAPRPRAAPRPPASQPRLRRSRRARLRRVVALTLLFSVLWVVIAFASAMSAPSNVPFALRAVEWLRDNGAAWLVSDVERFYYSLSSPSTGGPALRQLPRVGVGGTAGAGRAAAAGAGVGSGAYRPPPIAPLIYPPLPGEGQWRGTGLTVGGVSPVLLTTFRSDPAYPQMVAGVAWLDARLTRLTLYPGRYEPPNSGNPPAMVPEAMRTHLLATFNSGFKLEDDNGGFVAAGRVYAPLRDGQATLVGYRDGRTDIVSWSGGPVPGPEVEFARQNLPLIVQDGRLNPNLSDGAEWGATLGNAVRVWRSGLGIDARGNLIYAAADQQTAESLAQILRRAGAVRAMELDINSEWVTFNFYAGWDAGAPHKLLPDMTRDATRYLTPDDRDFLAVYATGR